MAWGTNDEPLFEGQYDPNHFYTKVRDDKGHYEQVNTKVPPALYNLLHTIVNDPMFPDLKSPQDLIRDALVHRMRYLVEAGYIVELAPRVELNRIRMEMATADAEYEENGKMVSQIEANLRQAMHHRGDVARVRNLLRQAWDVHQLLPQRNADELKVILEEANQWVKMQTTPIDRD